ncbi:MAG: AI-2E family transporter [Clostridia bacterium]|nr:AI-2E family transporter [Clostridia bacterium]
MQKLDWKTCFKVCFSIFCLYLCIHYWDSAADFIKNCISAAAPFFIGCIMAYPLNILMSFYERHYFPKSTRTSTVKSRRPVCLVLSILTLVAFVAIVIGLVVPQIISCFSLLFAEIPTAITNLIDYLNELEFVPDDIIATLSSIDWKSILTQAYEFIKSGFSSVVDVVVTTVSSVASVLFSGFLGIIFALYILLSKDKLLFQCKRITSRYIKPKWLEKINYVLSILNDTFHKFIVGQCTEAVILGVLCTIGMTILRMPYAAMIGALTALMALVPIVGAFISGAVGAFLIFMESPVKALVFLIFIVVLQQLEGNLIYPKVVGSSIGLPALWVLTAVTVGGSVAGIAGMLIAVPIAASLYRLLRIEVNKAQENEAVPENEKTETAEE